MSTTLPHAAWLKKADHKVTTSDGVSVDVFELQIELSAAPILSAWAKSFRQHYCLDAQIDRLRRGTGKSCAEYLTDMVFPDESHDFGPATRSGDFAEILIADLLERQFGFWAPRTRYDDKLVRNESPKGTDVLAFKFHGASPSKPSRKDVLVSFESKAQLSGKKAVAPFATPTIPSSFNAFSRFHPFTRINRSIFRLASGDSRSLSKSIQPSRGASTHDILFLVLQSSSMAPLATAHSMTS
ncbi:hypothetical protein EMIT0P253_30203 [Pseudomonas sp. IT-P253]|uniref:hypothetical protein n=1 Tax=Pseudomonas sp. IT-P253 TaxID=3026455 RepID=UPI0039DFAA4B